MTWQEFFAGPYKTGGFGFDANVTGAVTVLPGEANLVGRCILTLSNSVLKAPMVSALETIMS